ncbi:MAG: arginine--tRNA ligase [Candidatus Saccharimonadales bacterium]
MKQEIAQALAGACKDLFNVDVTIELTRPDGQFGDFASNIALQLAGQVGKNPREIGEALAEALRGHASVADVQVAGPGFLNITLTDSALVMLADTRPERSLAGKTVLVEYSDPNPFKPLHAGHLYTTLVGDTLARLIQNAGAQTVRLNFGGDVGLHVGRCMWGIIQSLGGELPEKLADIPEYERAAWMGTCYVAGTSAYEDDEAAKAAIIAYNKRVYEVQATGDHDTPFAQLYWTCRQWSYEYFAVLYEQLEVVPFDRYIPESEVTPLGVETVRTQLANGVYEKSGEAVIFDGEKFGLHTRVFINSEGLPTYETKDVGLSLTKWDDYHFDESIIITANEQSQYMQVVIKSIEQFAPEPAQRTRHLTHGMVKLQGGTKMSSRKGNIVTALEILEAAREAGRETGNSPDEHTILAAVKYAFAKNRIGGDIAYDPKESIALEGNSGPYLQYAHARARSILQKLQFEAAPIENLEADERTLLRKIGEYAEVVERATNELLPHHICTYLYELAQEFNRFYEKNRVVGDSRENVRAQLVQKYADSLENGLGLLGVYAPDKL